ncbi:hypothetical protein [Pontibacillus yanchengensis]|uniref:Uncharacterized protein n=1 Tax=Pontibacillus yanchengensis Y32 TaxID=1385514 RepID=A0A0A2TG37_9BACI|nr:hypothetical protein [Pontibacillus yanchengensis]KGP74519.1 hypothetical protein N782_12655 [Pontibacillus yanchengensis Y32]
MNYVSLAIKHQPFKTKEEMNQAVRCHIVEHGGHLSATEIEMIHLLSVMHVSIQGWRILKMIRLPI